MIKGIIFDWIGTLYERDKGLYPDSVGVISALRDKGYRLGLVTLTKEGLGRTREIGESGIMQDFNSIRLAKEKTESKYLECMKDLGTLPEQTAIIDDRTIRGIQMGNQMGCQTYWIQRGDYADETPTEETGQPTHIITTVEDLFEFF